MQAPTTRSLLLLIVLAACAVAWLLVGGREGPSDPARERSGHDARGARLEGERSAGAASPSTDELVSGGGPTLAGRELCPLEVLDDGVHARTLRLRGRVLDALGRPAAGAEVHLRHGRLRAKPAVSAANGGYELRVSWSDLDLHAVPSVYAVLDGDLAGVVRVALDVASSGEIQIEDLLLSSAVQIEVQVRSERGKPAAGARVVLARFDLLEERERLMELEADRAGRVVFRGVPDGGYGAYALHDRHGRGEARLLLPRDADERVEVTLEPARRTLEIEVVHAMTHAPLGGVDIEVRVRGTVEGSSREERLEPQPRGLVTDERGRVRVRSLPAVSALTVGARAPGFVPRTEARAPLFPADQTRSAVVPEAARHLRVVLQPLVRWSWPLAVVAGEIPRSGTKVRLNLSPFHGFVATVPARVEAHEVVAHLPHTLARGWLPGTAHLPDGRRGSVALGRGAPTDRTIRFAMPERQTYDVRYPDGAPATGTRLVAWPATEPATVDRHGSVHLLSMSRAHQRSLFTVVEPWERGEPGIGPSSPGGGLRVGPAASGSDAAGTLVVGRPQPVHLRFRREGRPVWPRGLEIEHLPTHRRMHHFASEPVQGAVQFVLQGAPAEGERKLRLTFSGHGPLVITVPPVAKSPRFEEVIELSQECVVHVRTVLGNFEAANLVAERRDPESARWTTLETSWARAPGHPATRQLSGFAPGRYRVRHMDARVTTEAFSVRPTSSDIYVDLDLRGLVRHEGQVVLPPGHEVGAASVRAVDDPTPHEGLDVGAGRVRAAGGGAGHFVMWRRPGERLEVRVHHPELLAHPTRGRAVLSEAVDRVRLELAPRGPAREGDGG